ncbi:MAG: Flp pilus assembly complex ATPase component TadA [Treponema sp.]|nr:Flp pilus assembly complex ATPase component TadA [Treponema sp.]
MRKYEFKLTPAYCLYNGIAVVNQQGSHICFMTENPSDAALSARLEKAFLNYVSYVIRQEDCPAEFKDKACISFIRGNRAEIKRYVSKIFIRQDEKAEQKGTEGLEVASVADVEKENETAAVILLDTIMTDARNRNATDIHIEKNCVKFRVCGKLETVLDIQEDKICELIQRIKFLAGMNVLEKRRSQDGHFIYGETNPVFVRVSVMSVLGSNKNDTEESVVIRILDTQRLPLSVDTLGFTLQQQEKISVITGEKNGLVLICGPTGAGKSTTAASILVDIEKQNQGNLKIVSLEDPPEYIIQGVTQIQIDEKINNSFDEALRHVFRQDPDVLMIGEIRDENTAGVAVRAALTGHLVFATLHTDSAGGAILRLENLGIPRNLIVSVLKGVITQELRFSGGKMRLAADVSIPLDSICEVLDKNASEDELDDYFEHNTNYAQFLDDIVEILKSKHSPLSGAEKKSRPKILIRTGKKRQGEKAV